MNMKIHSPEGDLMDEVVELSSTAPLFSGGKIGVLENGKPNADLLLTKIAEGLAGKIDAKFSTTTGKAKELMLLQHAILKLLECLQKKFNWF